MRKLLIPVLVLLSFVAVAQDSLKQHLILTSVSLYSKNFWRGNIYGNNAPAISGTLAMRLKNNFELGATGTSPTSGNRDGYGIWMELYASHTMGRFTVTVNDYYFFNAQDSLNDYFNWKRTNTQHIIEGRLKYNSGRFNTTASYVLYTANTAVNSLYLEAEYFLVPNLISMSAGAVFGPSSLNFYDKGGVTHFGFTGYRDIQISKELSLPLKISIMTSPNYKNASKYPAFTQNPINLIVGISF
jgi:hypothetical protein